MILSLIGTILILSEVATDLGDGFHFDWSVSLGTIILAVSTGSVIWVSVKTTIKQTVKAQTELTAAIKSISERVSEVKAQSLIHAEKLEKIGILQEQLLNGKRRMDALDERILHIERNR